MGNTKLAVGLVDDSGRIALQTRVRTPVREGSAAAVDRLITMGKEVLAASPSPVAGLGIAFGGMVDKARRIALASPNFPQWQAVPLVEILAEATGLPAAMDNDANAGALAEAWVGEGVGCSEFVYLTVSTGVGGAFVWDGRLLRGHDGLAGEIGHMSIMPDGPPCGCGKQGCLESLVSGPAIAREAERRLAGWGSASLLHSLARTRGGLTGADVHEAARQGDPIALAVLAQAGTYLGIGIANAANLLNPACFILGGGVVGSWEFIYPALRRAFKEHAVRDLGERTPVKAASAHLDVGLIGAAAVFREAEAGALPAMTA
ncbi:MAG TPA: ROK family protein [Limnochordia bacterium]